MAALSLHVSYCGDTDARRAPHYMLIVTGRTEPLSGHHMEVMTSPDTALLSFTCPMRPLLLITQSRSAKTALLNITARLHLHQ